MQPGNEDTENEDTLAQEPQNGIAAADEGADEGAAEAEDTAETEAESEAQEDIPWWKKPKPPRTEEDWRQIEFLNRLRSGIGDEKMTGLPLACIVRVIAYEEVPRANERYALVTVYGPDDKSWRMCVIRGNAPLGEEMLFVSEDAALPLDDRWKNPVACSVKIKVYKFGAGIKIRRLLPIVKRNIYKHNNGVLYPLEAFARDLRHCRLGEDCSQQLNLDCHTELKLRQNTKKPKPIDNEIKHYTEPAPAVAKARKKEARERAFKLKSRREASFKFLDKVRWHRLDAHSRPKNPPSGGAEGKFSPGKTKAEEPDKK